MQERLEVKFIYVLIKKISRERVFEWLNSKLDQNTQFTINFVFIAKLHIASLKTQIDGST